MTTTDVALSDQKTLDFLRESMDAKHQLYIECRARGSTPVAAARTAGFRDPDVSAIKLERDMNIRAAVEALVRLTSRQLQITKRDVIEGMLDAVRVSANAAEMTKAWREIGLLIGAYESTKAPAERDITPTKEQFAEMSDDELAKHAALEGDFKPLTLEPVNAPS